MGQAPLLNKEEQRLRNLYASPFCRLPDELLAAIFAVDYRPTQTSELSYDYVYAEADHHILRLSQVCSRWREAALSTATLWASVHLDVTPSHLVTASTVEALALRLDRSRSALLHMHLTFRIPATDDLDLYDIDEPTGQLFELARQQCDRVVSLTADTSVITGLFPMMPVPLLKKLQVRIVGCDLERLVLFSGSTPTQQQPDLVVEDLSVELPMLSRTYLALRENSGAPRATADTPAIDQRSKLKSLRIVMIGNESGPMEIISSAAETLEQLEWRESVPCIPSLSTATGLSLPSIKRLSLEGYAPMTPFIWREPTFMPRDLVPEHSSSLSSMPRLESLQLAPKGFQRSRRYMFVLPLSHPHASATASSSHHPAATTANTTLVSSSTASDLELFMQHSYFPSLQHFTLAGSAAALLPAPRTPAAEPASHVHAESALETFVTVHASTLREAFVPFVPMPALSLALSADAREGPESRAEQATLKLAFAFRHAYMPDEQRSVAFLRSLLPPPYFTKPKQHTAPRLSARGVELVLVRDKGVWEHSYKNLAKEYAPLSINHARVTLVTANPA